MVTIREIFDLYGKDFSLQWCCGQEAANHQVSAPEVHRPGLSITGHSKEFTYEGLLLFGRAEWTYLSELSTSVCLERLQALFRKPPSAVIVTRGLQPPPELEKICREQSIPLFTSSWRTMSLLARLTILLTEAFAPKATLHGTLVEVFGVGVLLQGDSGVGKSESALGLIERGHRLVADDIVHVRQRESGVLEGRGGEVGSHMMEIRGIGLINVAHLYGAVCVRSCKQLDLIAKLEPWDAEASYDRLGLEEMYQEVLESKVPLYVLPIRPGRDMVLLIETIALQHRLKGMGIHSAQEFQQQLRAKIRSKGGVHDYAS